MCIQQIVVSKVYAIISSYTNEHVFRKLRYVKTLTYMENAQIYVNYMVLITLPKSSPLQILQNVLIP